MNIQTQIGQVEELDTLYFKAQPVDGMGGEVCWSEEVGEEFASFDVDPVEKELDSLLP
jgi:hypothetical protein